MDIDNVVRILRTIYTAGVVEYIASELFIFVCLLAAVTYFTHSSCPNDRPVTWFAIRSRGTISRHRGSRWIGRTFRPDGAAAISRRRFTPQASHKLPTIPIQRVKSIIRLSDETRRQVHPAYRLRLHDRHSGARPAPHGPDAPRPARSSEHRDFHLRI